MREHFYFKDVQRITGVKLGRLFPWIENGWVTVSVQKAEGPGERNVFSRQDLYRIALFKRLTDCGIQRPEAAAALSMNEAVWAAEAGPVWLLVDRASKTITAHCPDAKYVGNLKEGRKNPGEVLEKKVADFFSKGAGDVVIIDFAAIVREIDSKA